MQPFARSAASAGITPSKSDLMPASADELRVNRSMWAATLYC